MFKEDHMNKEFLQERKNIEENANNINHWNQIQK